MTRPFPKVPLGSVLKIRKDFFILDDTAQYRRVRVQLHNKGIVLRDVVHGSDLRTKRQQVVKAGDLLVAEIDAKVGGFGIAPPDLEGAIVSSHYFLYEIDEAKCLCGWLDAFIRSGGLQQQVTARGSTNYAAIRSEHVLKFEIPLPSPAEQRRLVAAIAKLSSKLEEARAIRRQTIKEADRLLSAELDRVFASVRETAEPISIGRGGGFVTSGPRGWGDYYSENGDRRLIRVEDVTDRELHLSTAARVSLPSCAGDVERSRVQVGDVLVTITGAIGRVGVVRQFDMPCHISQHVALIRPPASILSDYLYWYLRSPYFGRSQTEGKTYGATKPGINLTSLRTLQVITPTKDDQRHIVAYLDKLQGKVDVVNQLQAETAAELDAMLPSILDEALR